MDAFLMRLFQSQVWTQCRFALISYDEFNAALSVRLGRAEPATTLGSPTVLGEDFVARSAARAIEPALRVWHPAQAFLTAAANVSKALWGQSGNFARAREALRQSLQVTDSSPLKQTTMRNNFDHFDERLVTWWKKSRDHNYVDLGFGNLAQSIRGIPHDEFFRTYDPATGDIWFWGQPYNLPVIAEEIRRIEPIALAESMRH